MPTIDFSEYLDGLYSYAVVLSRNRTEAEDLVQETCLRALRAMQSLRPDSNVKSWLFTILRNVWFNRLRHWRRTPEIVELESDGTGPISVADTAKDPHATYVSNIEQEQVRNAIQQLSIDHREIIILREYEELSYQEIATVLECPLGTVMSRLSNARSKLRDLLSPYRWLIITRSDQPHKSWIQKDDLKDRWGLIENGKITDRADYFDGLTLRRTALAAHFEGRLRKTRLKRRAQKESLNV